MFQTVSQECESSGRQVGFGCDQMAPGPVSAFPCPTPWITALRVISNAAAGVFELEIHSSLLSLLLIGVAAVCPSPLSAAHGCHGEPRRRSVRPLPLLNSLLIPTRAGAEPHSHGENKAPSSVCIDCVSALALGCRAVLQHTLGWWRWRWWWGESFPAISESVTEFSVMRP